ncbi:hypothetical protein BKA67DRAFT_539396 [Truncatella angustata]|uniref:Copper acquisition factor BIM1-like domain-containing protein n=1 Tax=Truncatella angustata TaxID=152316 RepID=A0A9P8UCJ8_9PEZI|nr:uncharacterized protein BKA67DRAFT_539396 [Truncatella angustata]KAH6647539.1 hypothetical protein BKA67DRAFT_539396 [Truncatella angustata]KAH8205344.1 hypothetical protein TruAng_000423 [Truncatella angustata]
MATYSISQIYKLLAFAVGVQSHLHISYPGRRGDSLVRNGTVAETNGLSIGLENGTDSPIFPYGMQWQYPCGGLPVGQNRTSWPMSGGALAFQPGLQAGHSKALIYINLGLGTTPANYSQVMVPVFNIDGPTNAEYQDGICLANVPLPAGVTVSPGDNATIQIVEAAKHGAALYSCVDITFVETSEGAPLSSDGCTNSSSISFSAVSTGGGSRWGWYSAGQMIGLGLGVGLPLLIVVSLLSYFLWKARKELKASGERVGYDKVRAYIQE